MDANAVDLPEPMLDGISYTVRATDDIVEDIEVERSATVGDFVSRVRAEFFFDIYHLLYEDPATNEELDLVEASYSAISLVSLVPPGSCVNAFNPLVLHAHKMQKEGGYAASEAQDTGVAASAGQQLPPQANFSPGDRVKIVGLQGRPEWNGTVGRLERYIADKDRWEVRLDTMQASDAPLGLKPVNLELASVTREVADEFLKGMPITMQSGFLEGGLKDDRSKPRGALVFLCGSGDSGDSLCQKLSELSGGSFEAKLQAVGIATCVYPFPKGADGMGVVSERDWFDPLSMKNPKSSEDVCGICESLELVDTAIDKIVESGIAPSRIGLLGHGTGGCIALHSAYGQGRYAGQLGGVACMRSFLTEDSILTQAAAMRFQNGAVPSPPLFMSHGADDAGIDKSWVDVTHRRLGAAGVRVLPEVATFPGVGHDLCFAELAALLDFFAMVLLQQ